MNDYSLIECALLFAPFLLLVGFVWAPKTWTPGELVTAASMNTNIRDHLNEGLRSQTTTSTGTVNNFALDGPFAYVKMNNASALILTGALIDSGNVDGSRVTFEAINSSVTINHQDAGSTSSNRFTNDTGADISLAVGERAILMYDTANTTWRVGKASTGAILQSIGPVNFHPDPYVINWPEGDAAAPAGATLTKDGNSDLDRNDATYLYGGMAPELKLGPTATVSVKVTWPIFVSLPVAWRGKTICFSAEIRSDTASLGQLEIADGGTGGTTKSAFHDGDDTWKRIGFAHELTADGTKLDVSIVADIGAKDVAEVTALFDGLTLTLGPVVPLDFKPTPSTEGICYFGKLKGNIAADTDILNFDARRPFIVTNTSLRAGTAPTGQALIVDVNHWDGAAYQSMYTTKPQLAIAATEGGDDPDGTYRYRCFLGRKDDDALDDALLNIDVDQVGSVVVGADLQISVAVLQFQDPMKALKL